MIAGQYTLHADRGGNGGLTPKLGVVIHDSEGGENSLQLIKFCAAPGDRDNGHGGRYGGGYNAIATEDGTYYAVAGGKRSPYHAPPCNTLMWSICIPGRAAQTRDQWLDASSREYVRAVARYIVDRWNDDGRIWPLLYATPNDLLATGATRPTRAVGYTTHGNVSKAWHQTDHTDPGPQFPFDVLADDIDLLAYNTTSHHTTERAHIEAPIAVVVTEPIAVVVTAAPATRPPAPTPQEDKMATAHNTVEGRYAQFYGSGTLLADGSVHCLEVVWSGSPDEGKPDNAFMRAHNAAPDIVDQHYTLDTMRGLVLNGNTPDQIRDDAAPGGHWSAADLAPRT